MLNLSNYIKHKIIKEQFEKSCTTVTTVEEVKFVANSILLEHQKYNLIFECSYLKDYFFSIIKQYNANVSVINCESSLDRLNEDIKDIYSKSPTFCIFDHVNNCKDIQVLNSINKIPSILIC